MAVKRNQQSQQDSGIGDILALYSQFGPDAELKRQSERLAQAGGAVNTLAGLTSLQALPGDIAARRAQESAGLAATQAGTAATTANTGINQQLLPGQLEQQRAAIAALLQQTAHAGEMAPIELQGAKLGNAGKAFELTNAPIDAADRHRLAGAQVEHLGIAGSAERMQAKAQLAMAVKALLDAGAFGTPNGVKLSDLQKQQLAARFQDLPELAEAFKTMQTATEAEKARMDEQKKNSEKAVDWTNYSPSGVMPQQTGPGKFKL